MKVKHSCLSTDQQQMVLDNLGRIYKTAYKIWRQASLSASHWDDIRSEAVLEACRCALRYVPGKMSFADVSAFQVRKYLWKWIVAHCQGKNLGGDDTFVVDTIEEDSLEIDLLLQLLPCLPDRQREVIELRYGLSGKLPMTSKEVAVTLGIAKSPVNHAERRAVENLQKLTRGGVAVGMNVEEIRRSLSRGGDRKSSSYKSKAV